MFPSVLRKTLAILGLSLLVVAYYDVVGIRTTIVKQVKVYVKKSLTEEEVKEISTYKYAKEAFRFSDEITEIRGISPCEEDIGTVINLPFGIYLKVSYIRFNEKHICFYEANKLGHKDGWKTRHITGPYDITLPNKKIQKQILNYISYGTYRD